MATTDTFIEEQLELIDEQIEKINNSKVMKAADKLIQQRNKLTAARRALMGAGNTVTGSGGPRTTQLEVIQWFKRQDEDDFTVDEIAAGLSVGDSVIRGHLNRGKDEAFLKNGDGTWSLRDPEND